jgi:hypothetical protein
MSKKVNFSKINLLSVILAVVMLIIVISCGGGGGGGGGIIPPIGGGVGSGGSGGGSPDISFNNQGYLIIETKSNSLNTSSLSFNFQTSSSNPNILSNENNNINRNTLNNIREFRCGFNPSNKDNLNNNILYSSSAPNLNDIRNFQVYDGATNNTVTVTAK